MWVLRIVFAGGLLITIGQRAIAQQPPGQLQRMRDEVRTAKVASNTAAQHRGDASPSFMDDSSESPFATLLELAIASPYLIPRCLAGDDDWDEPYYESHPYAYLDPITNGPPPALGWTTPWLTRVRSDYSNNGSLSQATGQLLLNWANRIGIDANWRYLEEDFRKGRSDDLWMGDANLVLRFAQSEKLQMRSGLGAAWFADDIETNVGFHFTYEGDWFPVQPWVVSTEFDAGRLGSAWTIHTRATIGLQWHGTEFFTGYDHLSIGSENVDRFVLGVRFWL